MTGVEEVGLLKRLMSSSRLAGGATTVNAQLFPGDTEVFVVGESNYQGALNEICGGKCPEGHRREDVAILAPEPDSPYDGNAVAVLVQGMKVGYLDRPTAKTLQPGIIRQQRRIGKPVAVPALINGGWDRGAGDEGHYGVRLYIARADFS